MSPFWRNLIIRALLTAVVVGLGMLATAWGQGSFHADYLTVAATAIGAAASVIVTALTTLVGEPTSGSFTE